LGYKSAAGSNLDIVDINHLIDTQQSICLNEEANHTHKNLFMGDETLVLKSDADEQLLLQIRFSEAVKLHSLKFVAPDDGSAPKTIKIFVNPTDMDFSDCENNPATQELELRPSDFLAGASVPLKFVKFQKVSNIAIFVEDNHSDGELDYTQMSSLHLFGVPIHTTNMSNLKKVG